MSYRKVWGSRAGIVICAITFSAEGASSTNDSYSPDTIFSISIEPTPQSEILKDRFFEEFSTSDPSVFDRFSGPAARLIWEGRQETRKYESIERWNSDGARMFASIGMDSLRTAAAAALPFELWEEMWTGRFLDFVEGTIGNPEEEHSGVTGISYSAVRSSWERSSERGGIRWGIRPWRTNPYLYLLAHAGRLDGRPLILFEGRGGYNMFGSTKLEGRLTLQLPASFRLAGGYSFNPARTEMFDRSATQFGVTLERETGFRSRIPDNVFYVGFRSGDPFGSSGGKPQNLILAGLSHRW